MSNISFLSNPAELSLTGNQIRFKIAGKNAFSNTNTPAVNKLYITGPHYHVIEGSTAPDDIPYLPDGSLRTAFNYYYAINVGYQQFTWNSKKVFLYCSNDSANPIYNYPSGEPAGGDLYLQQLTAWFRQNPMLNQDFDIQYNQADQCIDFISRKPGPAYHLALTTTEPANMVLGTPGDIERITDNYMIGIRPESGGNVITEMERPIRHHNAADGALPEDYEATKSGVITLDIADLLKEEQRKHFSFPTPKYYGKNHNLVKQFKLFAFEKFGNPPLEQGGEYSTDLYALQGKISSYEEGELNFMKKTFLDKLAESGMFLSNAPAEKVTDIYAPERLYYVYGNAGTFKTVVKQYYADGTDATDIKESYFVNKYQVRELFVSYDKIRTNQPKTLVKYEVYIADSNNNQVSEIRTFIVDYKVQPWARYFFFLNDYNVYECIRTTGKISKSRKVSKDFVNIPLPEDFIHLDKEEKQIKSDALTTYECNSGYFGNKYLADYFQEFLMSADVFWLKLGAAYPVNIMDAKQDVTGDGDYLPFCKYNLTHGLHSDFTEEYTAQEPISLGDFNMDFNTDFFIGAVSELYETVLDEQFDVWGGDPSLPLGWQTIGDSVVVNDANRLKMISFGDCALSFNTSYLTKVLYKLSFTVDSISMYGAFYLQAGAFQTTFIKAAGEYSFTFFFASLSALSNIFIVRTFALSGANEVNAILSNIKLEYEYVELEDTLLEDSFDMWAPESDIPLPLEWTAFGLWNETNFLANENGKLRLTTTSATPPIYSLQHNFKIEANATYRVTSNFEELVGYIVRFYSGQNMLGTIDDTGNQTFTFTAPADLYSFDLKFEGSGANRTALLAYFKIEKI